MLRYFLLNGRAEEVYKLQDTDKGIRRYQCLGFHTRVLIPIKTEIIIVKLV